MRLGERGNGQDSKQKMAAGTSRNEWMVMEGLLRFPGMDSETFVSLKTNLTARHVRQDRWPKDLADTDANLNEFSSQRHFAGCSFDFHDPWKTILSRLSHSLAAGAGGGKNELGEDLRARLLEPPAGPCSARHGLSGFPVILRKYKPCDRGVNPFVATVISLQGMASAVPWSV